MNPRVRMQRFVARTLPFFLLLSYFLIDSLVSRLAPRYPCGVTVYVAHPIRSILKSFSFFLFLILL
jgi:hypothetical protein